MKQALPAPAAVLVLLLAVTATAETYSLQFSRRSDRLSWRPTLPSWNYRTPVTLSAGGDSTSMLRLSASASMSATLDQRGDVNNWQENANVRTSLLYPILGPRASVGITANMTSRNATLLQQKTRNQTVNFRFQYQPLAGMDALFEDLRFDVTPGLITARRASPANPDSLIEETGLQYTGSMRTAPEVDLFGRRLSTNLSLTKRDNTLQNNKSRSDNLSVSSAYTLPGDVRTNVTVSESRSQTGVTRSVISPADTAVVAELSESRTTRVSTSLSTKLAGYDMRLSQSWSSGLNTNTANEDSDPRNRFFARDRESEDLSFSGGLSGRLSTSLTGQVRLTWAGSDDRRLPVQLGPDTPCPFVRSGDRCRDPTDDRDDRDLNLGGSLDWDLGRERRLQLSLSSRMSRVDNPGAPEQDRDSFNRVLQLTFRGTRASGLHYDVSLSSNRAHRVNLDVTRSADNQRSNELRLATNTSYERLGAQFSHNFDISARRTIFDFDREVNPGTANRRSNIRRGWSMRHTIRRSLLDALQLTTTYSYSADDFGTLVVEEGSQIVEEDNNDHRVSFGMIYRPSPAMSVGATYSYRLDRRWDLDYGRYGAERDLAFRNAHRNLAVSMDYKPTGYTGMTARLSRSQQQAGTYDDLSISLSRTF